APEQTSTSTAWLSPNAHREGGRAVASAGRPSTWTTDPSSATVRAPRTTKATTNGAGDASSTSTTIGSPDPTIPKVRWTASPPGTRIAVWTTGAPSTSVCRTAGSRSGRRHRSSAPIHHASSHPASSGATTPVGSTWARRLPPSAPISLTIGSPHAVQLGLRLPQHQRRDEIGGTRALVEDGAHERGDRHVDTVLSGEVEDRSCALHALRDHVHLADHVVERAPLAELEAHVAVAALLARARRDEVAHARETGEGERVAPERDAEPRQLGKPAGDEGCLGVVAVPEASGDARRDRDHVLQRAGDLTPDDVGVRVHAERLRHEELLERARDFVVAHRDH